MGIDGQVKYDWALRKRTIQKMQKKPNKKQGAFCKETQENQMNVDLTVTSPFHHKTKRHQTPLIWLGPVDTVHQKSGSETWTWNREHCGIGFCFAAEGVHRFVEEDLARGHEKIDIKKKKNIKKQHIFEKGLTTLLIFSLVNIFRSEGKTTQQHKVKELS